MDVSYLSLLPGLCLMVVISAWNPRAGEGAAMLWLMSQRAFLVGRRTLRRRVAVVVRVVDPALLRAALLSPAAWGGIKQLQPISGG